MSVPPELAMDYMLTSRCSENFGPVLPIVEVEDVDEAIQIVSDRFVYRNTC